MAMRTRRDDVSVVVPAIVVAGVISTVVMTAVVGVARAGVVVVGIAGTRIVGHGAGGRCVRAFRIIGVLGFVAVAAHVVDGVVRGVIVDTVLGGVVVVHAARRGVVDAAGSGVLDTAGRRVVDAARGGFVDAAGGRVVDTVLRGVVIDAARCRVFNRGDRWPRRAALGCGIRRNSDADDPRTDCHPNYRSLHVTSS